MHNEVNKDISYYLINFLVLDRKLFIVLDRKLFIVLERIIPGIDI